MAEDLHDVARRFREGTLVEKSESKHTVLEADEGSPPMVGGFIPGPSRIISARRRPNGQWDVEFVDLFEVDGSEGETS